MNAGDEIIEVSLMPFPSKVVTEVWISAAADKALMGFARCNEGKRFARKLFEVAKAGFVHFESGPVRSEGQGVFAFGIRAHLFRLIGFYGDDGLKDEYFAIDADEKPGQKRGTRISARVAKVARIKQLGLIRKVSTI